VIPAPLFRPDVRGCEQSVQLKLFEIRYRRLARSLEWHCPDLAAPLKMFRAPLANEPNQSVNGGKPLVSRTNNATAVLFQVSKECTDRVGIQMIHQ